MEQNAPKSASWSFTPKSCQLAKEIDESASDVVGAGVVSQMMFSRDNGGEQRSHVFLGQSTMKAGYMRVLPRVVEQKAPWRFTPKKLAKEIDESASVVGVFRQGDG